MLRYRTINTSGRTSCALSETVPIEEAKRPQFEERDSADAEFARDEQMFGFEARKLLLAMSKDDRVDSFAATDATPIERREFP